MELEGERPRRIVQGMRRWTWRNRIGLGICAACLAAATLSAEVRLAPLFTAGAVLQRDEPLRIWGTANPGEAVEVEFAGHGATATTTADGRWLVSLPAQTFSREGRTLRVVGQNALVVPDLLVGDVWICSGQSNMEFTLQNSAGGPAEVAAANQPLIRQVKIARHLADEPQEDFAATPWLRGDQPDVARFTAVGYFFGRTMVGETGVPIGLINCTWSGTPVEPWMSAQALASRPEFAVVLERWRADLANYPARRRAYEENLASWQSAEAAALTKGAAAHRDFLKENSRPKLPPGSPDHPYPSNPSAIFNGMVHPLRHAAIRGILWYQGEANAVRAREYAALFHASILGWRETFRAPALPFYWVQIANFAVETDWPRLREAQGKALALPATGQVVTIDIGDANDLHPTNKREVGRRLAQIALAQLEHRAVEDSGPWVERIEFREGSAFVDFTHAAGLELRPGAGTALEVAGSDRHFHPAEGRVQAGRLAVSSSAVPQPIAVRYAWRAAPDATLLNAAGLPASPFRSDDW